MKGLHSTYVEPLNCVINESFLYTWEQNSSYQVEFTAYDDQSVAFALLDVEGSIFFDNQEFIIKQCFPDFKDRLQTKQIVAIHVYNEVARIRQRAVKSGTLTYSIHDVLSFYLDKNVFGFTFQVIGDFSKEKITDLGNSSGKEMLSKIISTWPDAVIYPDNKILRVYSNESWSKDYGNRIDYSHHSNDIKITYDSTAIVNQVMVYGKQKEDESYYFSPHLVTNQDSVNKWGVHPGEDISDDRFTDSAAIDAYALSQMTPEPTLTIETTYLETDRPIPGERRRLEIRETGYITTVQVVAFSWYPLDQSQLTKITLNTTAKTILDYQQNTKNQLNKALKHDKETDIKIRRIGKTAEEARNIASQLDQKVTDAETRAQKALDGQIFGKPITVEADALKVVELVAPVDDDSLALKKGEAYYVLTHAQAVVGLSEFISTLAPPYEVATEDVDGLLAKEDKTKLDQLDPPDIEARIEWLENQFKKE